MDRCAGRPAHSNPAAGVWARSGALGMTRGNDTRGTAIVAAKPIMTSAQRAQFG